MTQPGQSSHRQHRPTLFASIALLAATPVLLSSITANAQTPSDATSASEPKKLTPDQEAKEAYLRGDRLYAEGKYEDAVDAFEKAYKLSNRPALLFNLANAYERLARYEEAARVLRQFLPHAPEGQKDLIRQRIKSLETRVEKAQAHADEKKEQPPKKTDDKNQQQGQSGLNATTSAKPSETPVLGYVLLGAGVLGLGAGTYFAFSAKSARSNADSHCTQVGDSHLCDASAKKYLDRDATNSLAADIGFGVGAASSIVGLILVLTSGHHSDQEQTSSVRVLPSTSAQGAQLNIMGEF